MKKGFKLLSVAIVFALVLSMMSGVFAAVTLPGEDDDLSGQLVILHTNDSHGRIKEDGTSMGMSAVKYLADRTRMRALPSSSLMQATPFTAFPS